MGASNYPGLKFAKGSRTFDQQTEVRAAKAHELEVYRHVDERDGRKCTCCGRRGNPYAKTLLGKLHHDHIKERSLLGPTEAWNIALLCSQCHEFKRLQEITPHGDPEKGTLRYTVTAKAAKVIFKGRPRPAHVRIVKESE